MEESDIIDLEKRYWLLKAQSRTGRFDLETFGPLVSPPIHSSLSEGKRRDNTFSHPVHLFGGQMAERLGSRGN